MLITTRSESTVDAGQNLLWWLLPGELGGMAMPFLHADRWSTREIVSAAANRDDLPLLQDLGIRAVASFLNLPQARPIYAAAGIDFLCLPIPDGTAPSFAQAGEFVRFVDAHLSRGEAVAAHCAAGLGRTGTMLAAYLIAKGQSAPEAIREVRRAQPAAIETHAQVDFLHRFAHEWTARMPDG